MGLFQTELSQERATVYQYRPEAKTTDATAVQHWSESVPTTLKRRPFVQENPFQSCGSSFVGVILGILKAL